ncbi:MAG: hypothetical protein BHV77_11410 [Bacteroides sp. 43_108]|nr:MAG: hypothetical protein BHV77_11410 [Bacteroides sp. 43_108]
MSINDNKVKYDSGINVLGSIPDYVAMLEFICEYTGKNSESEQAFSFRTHKTFNRFLAAIKTSILQFANDDQKSMFLFAINSGDFSVREKLLVLFWQLVYGNTLFAKVTKEVFMKAVYQGRTSLSVIDVLSLLHHIKETEEGELNWSEETLKITASKYLTMLKKMNLAEGKTVKEICHPIITGQLFVYFIRWMVVTCPENRTLENPFVIFGFMDKRSIIERLKKVEYLTLWQINQMGEDVTIDLIDHE